ncbi:Muniscin C-terminal mu homology domain-containing protein [Limtongia smithiae]|uniref:Muniscin C-terminal mu homology domain-containing protein n=1 Tax=Limtongia smithiae TaxID=1125753 RepID=UPI0034CD9D27
MTSSQSSAMIVASPSMHAIHSKRRTTAALPDVSMTRQMTPPPVKPAAAKSSRFNRVSTIFKSSESGGRRLFGSSSSSKDKSKQVHGEQLGDSSSTREGSVEVSSIASGKSKTSAFVEPLQSQQLQQPPAQPMRVDSLMSSMRHGSFASSSAPSTPVHLTSFGASYDYHTANGNGHNNDPDAIHVIGTVEPQHMPPPPAAAHAPSPAVVSPPPPQQSTPPRVDSEGYSIPPPPAKDSSFATLSDGPPNEHSEQALHVDIQPTAIRDTSDAAAAAVDRVASTLRSRPTISGRSGRGRRSEVPAQHMSGGFPPVPDVLQQHHSIPPPPPAHRGEHHAGPITEESVAPSVAEIAPEATTPEVFTEKELPVPAEITTEESIVEKVLPPALVEEGAKEVEATPSPAEETVVSVPEPAATPVQEEEALIAEPQPPVRTPIAPGLSGSVVERVNVSMTGGVASQVLVVGEIALSLSEDTPASEPVPLRVTNTEVLDRILPNSSLLEPSPSGDFMLNSKMLSALPAIAFKYTVTNEAYVPVIVKPAWKFEAHQTSIIVSYSLNPSYPADEVVFSEFSFVIGIEGASATACQSKPPGIFNQEEGLMAIVYTSAESPEYTLRKGVEEMALVRFWTDGLAHEAEQGGVAVTFGFSPPAEVARVGIEIQDVKEDEEEDPFADEASSEQEWTAIPVIRSVSAGRYSAGAEK